MLLTWGSACFDPVEQCGAPSCAAAADAGTDAGIDAGRDAGIDAGRDAGTDAGRDAGTDAGHDAGTDAGCVAGACCVPAPSGLISRWDGEGTADDSTGLNPGTLSMGATFAAGKRGQAFAFTGMAMMTATSTNMPTGSADRTIELWARMDTDPAFQCLFAGYGQFGTLNAAYELGCVGRTLFFSNWGDQVWGPTLFLSAWHHVAVTNQGSTVRLYLDGNEVASGAQVLATPAGTPFFVGRVGAMTGYDIRLTGLADEIAVYSRALSASELRDIYRAGSFGKCR
ncbi:MAG: LamG domain-containing protein [Myxococcaceae bacterium]|nr:LamG domain-containing protein [Myxococcaceae bacterium]